MPLGSDPMGNPKLMQTLKRDSGLDYPGPALHQIGKDNSGCTAHLRWLCFWVPYPLSPHDQRENQCFSAFRQQESPSGQKSRLLRVLFWRPPRGWKVIRSTTQWASLGSSCGLLGSPKEDRQCLIHSLRVVFAPLVL